MQLKDLETKTKSSDSIFYQGVKFLCQLKKQSAETVQALSLQTFLSIPIIQVLLNRNLCTPAQIFDFLSPSFDPTKSKAEDMKDAKKAVSRILEAVEKKEKILIFGDYDVDGMTATSIALLSLLPLGANINYYLPHRVKDGYGLSKKIIDLAAKNDYKLVITVDNGTTSIEAAAAAKLAGIDLIITDHHQPKHDLPDAFALVNPHQNDCNYPFKHFCGAGVIFKIMQFLYQDKGLSIPEKVYELLLLGTVADVVSLTSENRFWVKFCLEKLNNSAKSFSFLCMAANANKLEKAKWSSIDLAFGIAPQLNALGRLDDPKSAVKFLISSRQDEVEKIGAGLLDINLKRRSVEAQIYEEIDAKIKSKKIDLDKSPIIVAASENWPPGVVGLVAGRLCNNYGRPTFIFHIDQNSGLAKGSARSIKKFDLFESLGQCKDLLKTFGGHRQAAGLSLPLEFLSQFQEQMSQIVLSQLSWDDLQPVLDVDAELSFLDLNQRFVTDLNRLEPFGHENMIPVFLFKDVVLAKPIEILKEKHIKTLCFWGGVLKPIIFFNRQDLIEVFEKIQDQPFSVVAQVALKNDYGRQGQFDLIGQDIIFFTS